MNAERTKVAVLGGGAGALAAAFELTATAERRAQFDVTVHQLGWRLGGKGASGRNREHHDRIEEHGLHIWFGFYDNGFDVMKRCYAELDRDPRAPLATWRDAFHPCDTVVLYEHWKTRWIGRQFTFPRNDMTPGTADQPSFWSAVRQAIDGLRALRRSLVEERGLVAAAAQPDDPLAQAHELARVREQAPAGAAERALFGEAEGVVRERLLDLLERFLGDVSREADLDADDWRFLYMTADLVIATLRGILADGVLTKGFGTINDRDLREWLHDHGCSGLTLEHSPILRGMYDLAFGYMDGRIDRPDMAAGATMSAMIRIGLGYKGALLWKMQAGMGDTVFTPLYEVLKRRGVKFEFFHWVTGLSPSADGRAVDAIELIEQARVRGGGEYRPTYPVEGLECWPSAPFLEQLEDEDRLRGHNLEQEPNPLGVEPTTLRRGADFDVVVLGIPVGGLSAICSELTAVAAGARLKAAIDHSATVMTQAFQLWLNRDLTDLGWPWVEDMAMSSYVEPMDTFCDMTHLLPREAWPPQFGVRDISYFCGPLADVIDDTPQTADARVKAEAIRYLEEDVGRLWPDAVGADGKFDWDLIAGPARTAGPARFDSQYWRANFMPSERYVLTPAGTVDSRIHPGDTGFANLFAAGDWTRNNIDGGSVEGAITSGLMAGRAAAGDDTPPLGVSEWLSGRGIQGEGT